MNPSTKEGGEETRVHREIPNNELQKMPHTKAQNSNPTIHEYGMKLPLWLD